MTVLITFFAGGEAFLVGVDLVVAAVVLRAAFRGRWAAVLSACVALIGAAGVTLSATPLPIWLYAIWGIVLVAWLVARRSGRWSRWWTIRADTALLLATLSALAFELPHDVRPRLHAGHESRIYVVGDSITAGIGREGGRTWPAILRDEHRIDVVDLSSAGLGCAQELRHIRDVPLGDGMVFIEIGGNDVLARLDPSQFGRDLDALVQHLSGPNRELVMLELPLFPFDNAYGREQRRVARERHVVLVPKAYFARVLASPGATVDGIHLSVTGQRLMSEMVWDVVGGDFRNPP